MAQYIDKNDLIAKIKNLGDIYKKCPTHNSYEEDLKEGRLIGYKDALDVINFLEIKEDNLFTEKKVEKELAEIYINILDKKFGNKLPRLKGKQLAEFKNFINTCEQTFHMKYFDYHATQGKLFEKLALLWAVWGKEHLHTEIKEINLEKEYEEFVANDPVYNKLVNGIVGKAIAKYFFGLGLKHIKENKI